MDLANFTTADQPSRLRLCHPSTGAELTHDGAPVVVMVHGPDSPTMREVERRISDRRLQAASRTGRVSLTAEQVEQEVIEKLAAAVAGWQNIHKGGEPLVYSAAAARELIADHGWIRDQVDRFYSDRGNFFAATSSKPFGKSSARTSA